MSIDGNWSVCYEMKAPYLLDNNFPTAKKFNDSEAIKGFVNIIKIYLSVFIVLYRFII